MKQKNISKPEAGILLFFLLYNIVLSLLLPLFLVLLVPGFLLFPRLRPGLLLRFGWPWFDRRVKGAVIVHASSLGELNGLASFLNLLGKKKNRFAVSVFTDTGLRKGRELYPANPVFPLPFDHPFFLLPLFLSRPARIIVTEGEIWPNLIMMASLFRIRLSLINARITDRRFGTYRSLAVFYRMLFAGFDRILCQDRRSLENFRRIGVSANLEVCGSTKLDLIGSEPRPAASELARLRKDLGLGKSPVVLAGSLRGREYKLVVDSLEDRLASKGGPSLILVPRHLTMIPEILGYLKGRNISWSLFSKPGPSQRVTVVDRMGLLQKLYYLSDIVFVGGTIEPVGGHNPVEPALAMNAIVHGPSTDNNSLAFAALEDGRASVKAGPGGLKPAFDRLLSSPGLVSRLKKKARDAVLRCRGAAGRIYEAVFRED